MRRPWQVWLVLAISLLVAVAAVGLLSHRVLDSDRAEALATDRASQEELARLAMWRLDSAMSMLIAQENAQPYFAYQSFYAASDVLSGNAAEASPGSSKLPSPLLTADNPPVRLYFQVNSRGEFSSPTVPTPELMASVVPAYLNEEKVAENGYWLQTLSQLVTLDRLVAALREADRPTPVEQPVLANLPSQITAGRRQVELRQQRISQTAPPLEIQAISQSELNDNEFQMRSHFALQAPAINNVSVPAGVSMTVMKPIWLDGELLLARRVVGRGSESIQGCWLNWSALKRKLQATIHDLLPDAALVPVDSAEADQRSHVMAVLPVELVPGQGPVLIVTGQTPVRLALWVSWCSLALAAAAVVFLLRGVLGLSERRAAFVSAVTHELRTPLTTFRMYVDMLAAGMVRDEQTRGEYLEILRREADRLTHLVENVLAYARLERGGPGARIRPVQVADLLTQIGDRLESRATQGNFRLQEDAPPEVLESQVIADPAAVEQILFNLVDNACKYAREAEDRSLQLQIARDNGRVLLKVRDHGPGVADRERKRLFQPFRKSARDAADSAPGVGLGLSLSRRLARDMAGELSLDSNTKDGACFVLSLQAGRQRSGDAR